MKVICPDPGVWLAGCSSTFVVQTINPVPGKITDAHRVGRCTMPIPYPEDGEEQIGHSTARHSEPTYYPFLTGRSIIASSPEMAEMILRRGYNYCLSMGLQKVQFYPHQLVNHAYRTNFMTLNETKSSGTA